jgi:alpha-mannosidase
MSALMPAEDGGDLILRVYEAAGQAADAVKIHFTAPIASAAEVNLMEDKGRPVTIEGNAIQFGMRPFEIKTFRLHPAPQAK